MIDRRINLHVPGHELRVIDHGGQRESEKGDAQ
jgi:hypothetical protein